ncbi:MAG TPA: MFS transporter [Gemmataceae bacterium]|jgi:MFS family permease|nr:MFS transporter [Gemmataceae bacterium]
MEAAHDPYTALRIPDFRRLLTGNMLASVGTQMQSVAVGWELYQRTGSATALGLVGLVQFLPVILLSLPAGHAADHFSRKGLLMGAQALMASASLGLASLSFMQGPIPLMYACLLVVGISQAFNSPARWALVAMVVPEGALANAMTWNSSGWQIASVVGPALGGLVIEQTGMAGFAFLLTALCCLSCTVLVALLHPRPTKRLREPASLRTLLAGVNFVWSNPIILATITLDLFAVLFGGATALLPIYAKDILQVGPTGLGWLMAAPSLGALAMALALAHRPPLKRPGRALLWAVAGFGAATIVFGFSHNFLLSLTMLALTGALDNISVVVRSTLVQVLAPDAMRGRVAAVNAIFISSSNQLGAFESGITAAAFGPIASVAGGGFATLLVVALVIWKWPQVLRLGPLHQSQRVSEEEAAAEIMEQGEELTERRA